VTRFDVIGVGENSIDFVYRVPSLPRDGEAAKLRITRHERRAGGQVATTLAACAALGLRTSYAGAFGDDENGRFVREALQDAGVDVGWATTCRGANRYAVILVDNHTGERIVFWDRDAAVLWRPEAAPAEMVSAARLVHVDGVDLDASIRVARAACNADVPVTSDIDAVTEGTRDLLGAVTVPILAEHVPCELTGETDLERALRTIRRTHPGLLCVTRGERGAVLLAGDVFYEQPAFPVSVIDTTGAGDVFRAGFIYAWLRNEAPATVLRFATAAAALSCTRDGALGSGPTLGEVEALLRSGSM
jgi:sugar/nucleoside kinase (ribokinase family)